MARRFLVHGERACYHVVSRVVDRRFIFGDGEKKWFRRLMDELLAFSGLECLTFCLMDNHFHLLLAVPEAESAREEMGDEEFFRRLGHLYPAGEVEVIRLRVERLHRESPPLAEALRQRYLRRMFSLPVFVQELKRRFSRWYNGRSDRRGTLWEERYRSLLVEDGRALAAVAAYIDLNPVRAGLETRPGKFRWSGYGEARRGSRSARAGLVRVMDQGGCGSSWAEVAGAYARMLELAVGAAVAGSGVAGGTGPGRGGPAGRVRAMTEGLAVGERAFLENVFRSHRSWFGEKRKTGARRLCTRAGPPPGWAGIGCLRELR